MLETARRREGGRARRSAGARLPQLPWTSVTNPYAPMEVLSADQLEAIHTTSMRILEELGIEVMSARALARAAQPRAPEVDDATGHGAPRPRARGEGACRTRAGDVHTDSAQSGEARHARRQITSTSDWWRVRPTCTTSSAAAGRETTRTTATSCASRSTSTPYICSATRCARRSSCRRIPGIWTPIAPISSIPTACSTARPSARGARSTASG